MRLLIAALLLCASVVEAQTVTVTPATVVPGAAITVTMADGPGHVYDWITIVPVGAPSNAYTGIWFMTGTAIPPLPPAVGLTAATFPIPAPATAGVYEVRWLASGYYERLATSGPITVSGGPPTLLVNGDSNTTFDYVGGAENWAARVAAGLGLALDNMAVSGKYSNGVASDLPVMQSKAAVVCMVMIGGNDMAAVSVHGPTAGGGLMGYLGRMRAIITGLTQACGRVVIITPPFTLHPLEVARFDVWVAGLREVVSELGATFVDLFGYMRTLAAVQTQAAFEAYYLLPAVDRYHLSPAGHALIAALVLQQVR